MIKRVLRRRLFFKVMGLAAALVLFLHECYGAAMAPSIMGSRIGFAEFKRQFFAKYDPALAVNPIPREHQTLPAAYPDKFISESEFDITINACKQILIDGVGALRDAMASPVIIGGDSNYSYVQKLIVNSGDRIFVMGDLHGSAHAFLNNLENIGINDDMRLNDSNAYVVFTGDLIQKGRFGVENIYLAARMILANPGRVIWVRGNHETRRIILGNHGGLDAECKKKYPSGYQLIFTNILKLFDYLPCALYIGSNPQSSLIQVSHSGIYADVEYLRSERHEMYVAFKDENFTKIMSDFFMSGERVSCPIPKYDRFMYNGFHVGDCVIDDFKMRNFYRFPVSKLRNIILPQVVIIFRGHQHNNKAVSRITEYGDFTELPGDRAVPLRLGGMPVSVYTFMSCPEGMGGNDPLLGMGIEENCHVRGYGMVTAGSQPDLSDWTIQKFEWR